MMAYFSEEKILFSSDPFGEHYCSRYMFDDRCDINILTKEAIKYYANIVAPYSGLVKNKIASFLALKLPVNLIAPSHGIL